MELLLVIDTVAGETAVDLAIKVHRGTNYRQARAYSVHDGGFQFGGLVNGTSFPRRTERWERLPGPSIA
ncbi:MAG: hypothetical protein WBD20_28165 [Pirellulaceae bacterium]